MTIAELHDHLFDVLCVVDDICKKENVRWFLDSGTEIGAIREGDFIPWDDDMDIKVLAEDYPSFKAAMKKHLPSYMTLVEPWDFDPSFWFFVFRINDERFPIREDNEEDQWYHDYLRFVGTDVFIFTKAPSSKLIQHWLIFRNKLIYGLAMTHKYKICWDKFTAIEKLQVAGARFFNRLLGLTSKKACLWWWNGIQRYANKTCPYRFSSNYGPRALQFFSDDLFKETDYFPIRGRLFPVPAGYDLELKQIYGDYMTPVRDEKRYAQHTILR